MGMYKYCGIACDYGIPWHIVWLWNKVQSSVWELRVLGWRSPSRTVPGSGRESAAQKTFKSWTCNYSFESEMLSRSFKRRHADYLLQTYANLIEQCMEQHLRSDLCPVRLGLAKVSHLWARVDLERHVLTHLDMLSQSWGRNFAHFVQFKRLKRILKLLILDLELHGNPDFACCISSNRI